MELNYIKYTEGFKTWMQVLNYSKGSCKNYPQFIEWMMEYMKAHEIKQIEQITGEKISNYFEYLSITPTPHKNIVPSIGTLRARLTAVKLFGKYMRQTEQGQLEINVQYIGKSEYKPIILTVAEIEQLYESLQDDLLGMRDRAILAIYYGCGVRKSEGVALQLRDILPDKNLIYIRKGKNYKERYVPMIGRIKKDIINYITQARPMLLNKEVHEYFFVSMTGRAMNPGTISQRLQGILVKAGIGKKIGLHGLRHSIATHLLQQGMKLSEIARFLGHSSLESTQIYTHLANE
jgi:site-specific recombinase XerD